MVVMPTPITLGQADTNKCHSTRLAAILPELAALFGVAA